MSKRLLWILAAFMGLVMTGLILVQAYWINNAYQIKEKQFSQLVARSLSNITTHIENREASFIVYDYIRPQVQLDTSGSNVSISYRIDAGQRVIDGERSDFLNYNQKVIISQKSGKKTTGSTEVTIGNDSSVIVISPDSARMDSLPESNLSENIIMPGPEEIREKLRIKQEQIDRAMSRMIMPRLKIEERLSPDVVKTLINNELNNRNLGLEYEYAVVRSNNEVAFHSEGYAPDRSSKIYTAQLFPQDIFNKPNYLRIYFPDQRSFIYRSVGFMGITSIILTTIIIGIFILTLWVIFRQKRLSEMKNDFVNNMTHELKTPISTISLASQMLNDKSIPVENKNLGHISKIIDTESKRLGYQVEKVLQMAIFDKGKLKLKEKVLDMHEVISSAANNFELQVARRGGKLEWFPAATKSTIKADEVHMSNVLSNLLDNAIKYSRETPWISISTRNEKQYFVVRVQDKGIGISSENQKRIFEKFYRVPTGNVHNVKGFGLGLSYVKRIVEIHNGHIKLRSELNKGTRFDIFLPLYEE